MGTRGSSAGGVRCQRREANHSPPTSAEVRNCEAIHPLPNMSSWHSTYLSAGITSLYLDTFQSYICPRTNFGLVLNSTLPCMLCMKPHPMVTLIFCTNIILNFNLNTSLCISSNVRQFNLFTSLCFTLPPTYVYQRDELVLPGNFRSKKMFSSNSETVT
jgi:hypothetical protein